MIGYCFKGTPMQGWLVRRRPELVREPAPACGTIILYGQKHHHQTSFRDWLNQGRFPLFCVGVRCDAVLAEA